MVRGSTNPSQEVTGAKVTELQQQIRGLRNDVVSLQKQLTFSRDELAKQKVAAGQLRYWMILPIHFINLYLFSTDNQQKILASSAAAAQERESKLEKSISELQSECDKLKSNVTTLTQERDGLKDQLKEHDVLDSLQTKEKLKIVQVVFNSWPTNSISLKKTVTGFSLL